MERVMESAVLIFPSMPEKWTIQNTYDYVCACLAIQKRQSMAKGGLRCVYRNPEGLKCAVGHCIPDEEYSEDFETPMVDQLASVYARVPSLQSASFRLLNQLRIAHDLENTPEGLRWALKLVASRYGLTSGAEEAIKEWS